MPRDARGPATGYRRVGYGHGNGWPGVPGLAEWCAWEGFATLIFNFRGTGDSGGNFHALGWAQDLDAVVSWIIERPEVDPARVILLGSSMGATIAIYVTANRPEVAGLVSFAGPAVSRPRAEPAEAVERMRAMGIIRDPDFPPSWRSGLTRAWRSARRSGLGR